MLVCASSQKMSSASFGTSICLSSVIGSFYCTSSVIGSLSSVIGSVYCMSSAIGSLSSIYLHGVAGTGGGGAQYIRILKVCTLLNKKWVLHGVDPPLPPSMDNYALHAAPMTASTARPASLGASPASPAQFVVSTVSYTPMCLQHH